jgi:hypothetical protein
VRCLPTPGEANACVGYPEPAGSTSQWQDKIETAIQPYAAVITNYSTVMPGRAISDEALNRFLATAGSDGTYYTSCPASLTGAVVVIDMHGPCQVDAGNVTYNSAAQPGIVVVLNSDSSLTIAKNAEFWGVLYHANRPVAGGVDSNQPLITLGTGNPVVHGGVIIEGRGGFVAGSSGMQLEYESGVFDNIRTIGGAGIIQNTWRELPKG